MRPFLMGKQLWGNTFESWAPLEEREREREREKSHGHPPPSTNNRYKA